MNQLNLNITPEFEASLQQFMKVRCVMNESDAIAIAVRECLERLNQQLYRIDFTQWIGCAKRSPENPHPRFTSDDDLWSETK